jgi:hypothetical protein
MLAGFWHTLKHRIGLAKAIIFASVFVVIYAVALSNFLSVAQNTVSDFSAKQPKLPKGDAARTCLS